MSNRRLCYVAGPFAGHGDDEFSIRRQERINVARAYFVGHVLWRSGDYAPIVPHAIGDNCYGDEIAGSDGLRGDEIRVASIDSGAVMARAVGAVQGVFVLLLRDDRSISSGSAVEQDAFKRGAIESGRGPESSSWAGTFADFCKWRGVSSPDIAAWEMKLQNEPRELTLGILCTCGHKANVHIRKVWIDHPDDPKDVPPVWGSCVHFASNGLPMQCECPMYTPIPFMGYDDLKATRDARAKEGKREWESK